MGDFSSQQRALLEEIWRISEEGWHAGWMADIEFELWGIVQTGPAKCGQLQIDLGLIEKLKSLSKNAEGWFYWNEIQEEKWIGMEAWLKMYDGRIGKLSQ